MGFFAHGMQAGWIGALDDAGVEIHVMSGGSVARVTRSSAEEVERIARVVPATARDVATFASCGAIDELFVVSEPSNPSDADLARVRGAIANARARELGLRSPVRRLRFAASARKPKSRARSPTSRCGRLVNGTYVHDLVRVDPGIVSRWPHAAAWVAPSLQRAPWVVVRREASADAVAIGVRGVRRADRFSEFLSVGDAREILAPSALWGRPVRNERLGRMYEFLARFCSPHGLSLAPLGSFAFELATDVCTTHAQSDLDVLLDASGVPRDVLASVDVEVERLALAWGVRIDVELAYAHGAAALREILSQRERVLFKTPSGPQLLPCPV